jgi:nucleoside triphosphatase
MPVLYRNPVGKHFRVSGERLRWITTARALQYNAASRVQYLTLAVKKAPVSVISAELTSDQGITSMADQTFPEPTVGVFIFNPEKSVLLLKSHKWPDKYVVPGGHVELGEKIIAAAIREAKEETGLDVYDLEFICFQEFIYDPSFWRPRHFIFFDYACKTDSLDVQLNDEAESYVWEPLDEALRLPLDTFTRFSLEKYAGR